MGEFERTDGARGGVGEPVPAAAPVAAEAEAVAEADAVAKAEEAAAAARERQSHVRHELRTPLAVIYPLLSLLLDGGPGELTAQQREYLQVLDRNATRLEALITSATASGWADCSAAPPVVAAVDLGAVAREVLALRSADGTEGGGVTVDVVAEQAPRALADAEDVRQILGGLVRNAVAYTPATGTVTIRALALDPGRVALEVEDSGPGMAPEELDQAFDFGFRGELARELKVPGLGAGLWVCRELARRNGGDVRLVSGPDAGVTATITLPAVAEGQA